MSVQTDLFPNSLFLIISILVVTVDKFNEVKLIVTKLVVFENIGGVYDISTSFV